MNISALPYLFLLIAALLCFQPNRKVLLAAVGISVASALVFSRMYWIGLLWVLLLTMNLTAATSISVANYARRMCYLGFIMVAAGLTLHLLPGFVNMKVFIKLNSPLIRYPLRCISISIKHWSEYYC